MPCFEVINVKVTSIIKQKRNEDRYNIYIDNEFCFSSNVEDVVKYPIKVGLEVTEDELHCLIDYCEGAKAYEYALNLLSRRDYTSSEIEKRLKDKEFSSNTIVKVIEKLKVYGIINDIRYIEKYVHDSQKIKRYGIRKVLYNLESKGIEKSLFENVPQDEEIEFENAYNLAVKKLKLIGNKEDKKLRIYRHLTSKGYEYELIKKVLYRIFNDSESELI